MRKSLDHRRNEKRLNIKRRQTMNERQGNNRETGSDIKWLGRV